MFCRLCSKHFSNENSFINHKNSKKHKEAEAVKIMAHVASQQLIAAQQKEEKTTGEKEDDTTRKQINDLIVVKSDRAEKKYQQMELYLKKQEKLALELDQQEEEVIEESEVDEEDEKNWEDVCSEDEDMDQSGKYNFILNMRKSQNFPKRLFLK